MWFKVIERQMEVFNITQEEMAKLLGMTRGNIGHYLSGRRDPPLSNFIKLVSILDLLDKPLSEILNITKNEVVSWDISKPIVTQCPILSWNDAVEWPNNKDKVFSKQVEKLSNKIILGPDCYALQIKDDSMMSRFKNVFFKKGGYLLIDPNAKYESGDFVVIKRQGFDEVFFRKYANDGGTEYLHTISDETPSKTTILSKAKDYEIKGVVITHVDILKESI